MPCVPPRPPANAGPAHASRNRGGQSGPRRCARCRGGVGWTRHPAAGGALSTRIRRRVTEEERMIKPSTCGAVRLNLTRPRDDQPPLKVPVRAEERLVTTFTVWKFEEPDGAAHAESLLKTAEADGLVTIVDHA